MLVLLIAIAFNALACAYLYWASPHQQWLPAPLAPAYARALAWRALLVAGLAYGAALGVLYGVLTWVLFTCLWLGVWPLVPLLRLLKFPQRWLEWRRRRITPTWRALRDWVRRVWPRPGNTRMHADRIQSGAVVRARALTRRLWSQVVAAILLGWPLCLALSSGYAWFSGASSQGKTMFSMWLAALLWLILFSTIFLLRRAASAWLALAVANLIAWGWLWRAMN